MKVTLKFYKKKDRWFNDDPSNGFDEDDNEMVAGVPQVIEYFTGSKATKAEAEISTEWFKGCIPMRLIDNDIAGGVEYQLDLGYRMPKPIIWLCQVFWVYFEEAPEFLFVKIRKV